MRNDSTSPTHELAWAAGFFDGEGCICVSRYKPKNQNKVATVLSVSISQTDPEVLERFKAAVGDLGTIGGPYTHASGKKKQWKFKASGVERVESITSALWPWLGTIKRDQAQTAIAAAKAERRKVGAPILHFCKHGHDIGILGVRLMPDGERRCKQCERLRAQAAYYRKKGDLDEAQRVLDGTHISRKSWRTEEYRKPSA